MSTKREIPSTGNSAWHSEAGRRAQLGAGLLSPMPGEGGVCRMPRWVGGSEVVSPDPAEQCNRGRCGFVQAPKPLIICGMLSNLHKGRARCVEKLSRLIRFGRGVWFGPLRLGLYPIEKTGKSSWPRQQETCGLVTSLLACEAWEWRRRLERGRWHKLVEVPDGCYPGSHDLHHFHLG